MNRLCVFEDDKHKSLLPLVYNRPVYDLRCGMFSLLERINTYYPNYDIDLCCREYLAQVLKEKKQNNINSLKVNEYNYLFINGRLLMEKPIPIEGDEVVALNGETVVYARLNKENCQSVTADSFLNGSFKKNLNGKIKFIETDVILIDYFWDIIKLNISQIEKDFRQYVKNGTVKGELYDGVYLVNSHNIFVGKNSKIKPGCVLDAEEGPIYIGENVSIAPNSTIEGPVFIGNESKINAHSRILSGSNIGRVCKVGGEIEKTIIHDYSNKQHDGFLGHAYLGSWVNLGADTVNSNLKNTYDSVHIKLSHKMINSDQMFLGMAIGDHSKTAVNTTFMTGTVVGFGSNIVTSKYPPKFVPSFCWCIDKGIVPYDVITFLELAEKVMVRRNIILTEAEKTLYKIVYNLTEDERAK